ncbi:MAG: IMP cyclohydrolase [Deltaproteobacteria bacterium]|nr:IMP cyclohydrolase [Deltaproteobacteria bacterium]MBW2048500.1 IMP cyclohydrolase [Deltaproteobacteria bacterium]MBW2110489.1 IMP cyclohydrolase [Deltaproteobacteria bacterium]MBW2353147.1 IMP cyclohydrolase [Deltaproteobacteria bacterium]HDZ90721.1 IMP cyclohydrolase [Deltaproteobacteria bacterium]
MTELKKMYRTVMDDHFPLEITISFGDQVLTYKKRSWRIPDQESGEFIEKGLRYGENPGQEAALYELVNGNLVLGECQFIEPGSGLVSAITEDHMLQSGKHPGKINLTDVDNALNIMKYLGSGPAVVIVKHNNPCGVAYGSTLVEAYEKADMADRIAAFGGCALFNLPLDRATAERVGENYLEVVAAPDFEEGAVEILSKRSNLRVIRIPGMDRLSLYAHKRFVDFKSLIDGGLILQQSPLNRIGSAQDFMPASTEYRGKTYSIKRQPTDEEYQDLLFGWQVEQGITSNSVIYVKGGVTVGIGTGEQDRVGVAEIAIFKAYTKCADAICFRKHGLSHKELELMVEKGEKDRGLLAEVDEETKRIKGGLLGASMVSDAFFPFRDGVDVAIREGITAIVQPGGSMRDFEVIEACNEANPPVTMVFTGQRAFKH